MSTLPDTEDTHEMARTTARRGKARRRFINLPPSDEKEVFTTDALKREFAKRLQNFMIQKGWNQSDLARAAAKFTPDKKFNRDNISLYVRARQMPGPIFMQALLKALSVTREELIPHGAVATVDESAPPIAIKPVSSTMSHLQINMVVDTNLGLDIIALVRRGMADGEKK